MKRKRRYWYKLSLAIRGSIAEFTSDIGNMPVNQSSADHESASTLAAIIANCKRLIADAKLLLEHGSHGSALSLAILAFEEAGKGHREEMELVKTKRTPSWHQFRPIVAGFVLQLAVLQKYGIELIELPEQVAAELRARQESAKLISDIFRRPISDELRSTVAEASRPAVEQGDMKDLLPMMKELFKDQWPKSLLRPSF